MLLIDELHLIDQQLVEAVQQLNQLIQNMASPLHNPEQGISIIPITRQLLDTIEQLKMRYENVLNELESKGIKLEENEVPIMKALNPINFD